jgi:hypothetical protein
MATDGASSALPLFDELAFILGDSPEAGDSEAGEDEKNSNRNIASGETAPREMWDGDVQAYHQKDDSEDHKQYDHK